MCYLYIQYLHSLIIPLYSGALYIRFVVIWCLVRTLSVVEMLTDRMFSKTNGLLLLSSKKRPPLWGSLHRGSM